MKQTAASVTVRIPIEHKDGLTQMLRGKAHLTYSDLVREAIYLLLVQRGIIKDEQKTIT